jgi:hypothetical protein
MMARRIYLYICRHWLLCLLGGYQLCSILLTLLSGIDIGIPCIWLAMFGSTCPGCGLTRATCALFRLDPVAAFQANPLVFIVLPALAYYVVQDFHRNR